MHLALVKPLSYRKSLERCCSGSVTIEYVVLVGTMAIASLLAFVALGATFFGAFNFTRNFLLQPFP